MSLDDSDRDYDYGTRDVALGDDHTPDGDVADIAEALGVSKQGAYHALEQAMTSFRLAWSQRDTIFRMQARGHLVELIKGGDLACRRCLKNVTDGNAGCCVYPRGTAQRPRSNKRRPTDRLMKMDHRARVRAKCN